MKSVKNQLKLYSYEAAELNRLTNENTPQKRYYEIVREIISCRTNKGNNGETQSKYR